MEKPIKRAFTLVNLSGMRDLRTTGAMMKQLSNWALFAATLGVIAPASVLAQVFPLHRPGCCETCTQPMAACQCARTRAVVQTQLRPQSVTVLQPVTETHVRQEVYTERVPVTTTKTVTVDEGGYQMVWVPKPVTKQIAQTTCVTQQKTRAVPYQVTRVVPQTVTRMVPVQTVQHVTELVPTAMVAAPAPVMGCNTCATGHALAPHFHGMAMVPTLPISSTALTPIPSAPQTAQGPSAGTLGDWQSVPGRSAAPTPRSSSAPVPMPTDEPPQLPTPKTSGRFKSAPSAAVVWSAVGNGPRRPVIAAQDVAVK